MFAPVSRETGDAATRRLLVFILIALPVAVLAARSAEETAGLNNQGPDGLPEVSCASSNYTEIYLSPPPPVSIGKYYTTEQISIEAVGQVHISTRSGPNQPCIPMIADITSTIWQLTSKPPGSNAAITTNGLFNGRFTPDIDGTYVVRMVACALGCQMVFPGLTPFTIESVDREVTFETASALPFPPQIDPVPYDPCLSSFCDTQSDFPPDVRNFKCNDGGGAVDPQWVSVGNWQDVFDYELLEGVVQKARISRKDSPMNHYSQDFNFKVLADPQYLDLVSTDPEDAPDPKSMGVEWEVDYYPESLRPTVRDRVSIWGYWIHDCGHEPFFTEIHPPVGVATHRARPVHLPESLGLGSNLYAPGVVSELWFNGNAGEITDNCSWTGLHAPGNTSGDACLPGKSGGPNPIAGRGYSYNIYLPPSPEDVLREAGHDNPPPVELYYEAGGFPAGREPNILVIETDELTYLHVEVDLVGYTEETFGGRIVAAWQYPAPDNWGLRAFEFEVSSIDVHGDSDITCHDFYCPFFLGGDPRMWVNIPNVDQEWTRIVNCDECVFDESTYSFGGRPWRTSSNDSGRELGNDVLLFPEQLFTVSFSGYEDDWLETSDDAGFIQQVLPPPEQGALTGWPNNVCSDSSPEIEVPVAGTDIAASHCMDYNVNWRLSPLGPINSSLSQAGQALYDASLVNVADLNNCDSFIIIVCWDNTAAVLDFAEIAPVGTHPPGPVNEETIGLFKPQSVETLTWADIHPLDLKREFLNATQAQMDGFLEEFQQEVGQNHNDHPAWEFAVLEAALPPGMWEENFGDLDVLWPVWGDGDCDEDVDELDVLRSLMVAARVKPGAPCLLQTNANCDDDYTVADTVMILKFAAGFDVPMPAGTSEPNSCFAVGDEVHLELVLPPATSTPTPAPSATPTPTVTPTATPTPTPTATPTPTPDTTGPSITNVVDDPDPIDDGEGNCDDPDQTTISANVDDASGVQSVVLHYRFNYPTDTGPWNTGSATFNSQTGKWEITIDPPDIMFGLQGTIDWYFEATDTESNSTLFPANAPTSFEQTTVNYCD